MQDIFLDDSLEFSPLSIAKYLAQGTSKHSKESEVARILDEYFKDSPQRRPRAPSEKMLQRSLMPIEKEKYAEWNESVGKRLRREAQAMTGKWIGSR